MSGKPCTKKTAPEGVAFLLIETIDHQRVGFGRRRPKPFCYIEAPVCSRQAGAFCIRGERPLRQEGLGVHIHYATWTPMPVAVLVQLLMCFPAWRLARRRDINP